MHVRFILNNLYITRIIMVGHVTSHFEFQILSLSSFITITLLGMPVALCLVGDYTFSDDDIFTAIVTVWSLCSMR